MNLQRILSGCLQFSAVCLFVCGLLCTSGCTTAGTSIEVKQTPAINFSQNQTVMVIVKTRDADFNPKQVEQLADAIIDGLRKSAKFDKVYGITSVVEPFTNLKLSVVVQFVVVQNVWSIETTVSLIDLRDGMTLGKANINSHTEWAFFGGNVSNAIDRLGDQIVNFVIKN